MYNISFRSSPSTVFLILFSLSCAFIFLNLFFFILFCLICFNERCRDAPKSLRENIKNFRYKYWLNIKPICLTMLQKQYSIEIIIYVSHKNNIYMYMILLDFLTPIYKEIFTKIFTKTKNKITKRRKRKIVKIMLGMRCERIYCQFEEVLANNFYYVEKTICTFIFFIFFQIDSKNK